MSVRNDGLQDFPDKLYHVNTTPDNTMEAVAKTQFNAAIIDKASDFLCAIERMEVSTNGIPFYDGDQLPREQITVRSRTNLLAAPTVTPDLDTSCYSLTHLFEYLNSLVFNDPNGGADFRCTFSVSKDGFIILTLLDGKDFNQIQIEFPRRLNMILGLSTAVQEIDASLPPAPFTEAQSSFPRVDLGDDLDHIILQTNLPTNSDALGNAKLQVLTDFSSPTQYSNSMAYGANGTLVKAGFTSNIRQKLVYTPNERRYLELVGDFPIQDIEIACWYISIDGTIKRVVLPLGGSFEIKLGFYLRQ